MAEDTTDISNTVDFQSIARPGRLAALRDQAIARVVNHVLAEDFAGRLRLVLPSGTSVDIGGESAGPSARIALRDFSVFWHSLRRGALGFAESYVRGDWTTDDLTSVFRFFLENRLALARVGHRLFRVGRADRSYHKGRSNTRSMSRQNIAAHYDLGNDFYALWLDPTMTYSSGIFSLGASTLVEAQEAKYASVLEALEIEPGHDLLEVGCGWGGLAVRAAHRGAAVTGLTLSTEQLAWAEAAARREGLADRIDVRLTDYRDVDGTFDRIASIEMIEAVGEENWPVYFSTLHDLLAPGGVAVIQAITIDEALYPAYRARPDFIQRYIFPGGMLPTKALLREHAAAAGFSFETRETFGHSYARTLEEWRARFIAARREIDQLGFDDRFVRMWDYYLTYCVAGFERRTIDVGIYRLRKAADQARQTSVVQ